MQLLSGSEVESIISYKFRRIPSIRTIIPATHLVSFFQNLAEFRIDFIYFTSFKCVRTEKIKVKLSKIKGKNQPAAIEIKSYTQSTNTHIHRGVTKGERGPRRLLWEVSGRRLGSRARSRFARSSRDSRPSSRAPRASCRYPAD